MDERFADEQQADDQADVLSKLSDEQELRLLSPGGARVEDDRPAEGDAVVVRQFRPRRVSTSPESPPPAGVRPSFARQFSVQSRRHSFMVTDYGPGSVDKSLESVIVPGAEPPVDELPEEDSAESGVQITPDASCVLDLSRLDAAPSADDLRTSRTYPTVFNVTGTIPSLIGAKNKRQLIALEIAKRGRLYAKRKKDRLVEKDGECRIVYTKVRNRSHRLLHDFFTTMLELRWRYHFVVFALAFVVSWLAFGLVWWGLAAYEASRARRPANDSVGVDVEPCVVGVSDYTTALLFSIETQQTIGYGTRAITASCPLAIVVMMLQSIYGVVVQCILTGIIFAKLARPKRRARTIIFSKKAVICERDGQRTMMFRVGDIRRSQILATSVSVLLTERRTTKEGECLPIATREMKVTTASGGEFFFLAWPIEVLHKIDGDSPLWELSEADLLQKDWEFIVVLEGVAEVTGASFQVRTSYLPSEVLWGHRLKSLLNKSTGGFLEIDYTYFDEIEPILMTDSSASAASRRRHGDDDKQPNRDEYTELAHRREPTQLSTEKHQVFMSAL